MVSHHHPLSDTPKELYLWDMASSYRYNTWLFPITAFSLVCLMFFCRMFASLPYTESCLSGNCFFILHHLYCFYSFGIGWFKQQAGSAPWITIQQFPLWISIEPLDECCLVLQIGLIHFISLFESLFYWRFSLRYLFRCALRKERLQCGMRAQYLFDFAIMR